MKEKKKVWKEEKLLGGRAPNWSYLGSEMPPMMPQPQTFPTDDVEEAIHGSHLSTVNKTKGWSRKLKMHLLSDMLAS